MAGFGHLKQLERDLLHTHRLLQYLAPSSSDKFERHRCEQLQQRFRPQRHQL